MRILVIVASVTSVESLNLSGPQFSHLWKESYTVLSHIHLLKITKVSELEKIWEVWALGQAISPEISLLGAGSLLFLGASILSQVLFLEFHSVSEEFFPCIFTIIV